MIAARDREVARHKLLLSPYAAPRKKNCGAAALLEQKSG
jgi:hypothetical protein